MERRQKILVLARAIEAVFTDSEWTEVGYLTSQDEYITKHPRLLRSLHWGDKDYKGHVIETVAVLLDADPANLRKLVEYAPLVEWLERSEPAALDALRADVYGTVVPAVEPTGSEAALKALADAQVLLEARGPSSALDRVHTGLHGFLKGACQGAGLVVPADATANQLLKALLEGHPALAELGPRRDEVRRMIRTSASIIDAMGTLRNNASLAHPNEEILDHDEALLAINLARSLLAFLDAKLRAPAA